MEDLREGNQVETEYAIHNLARLITTDLQLFPKEGRCSCSGLGYSSQDSFPSKQRRLVRCLNLVRASFAGLTEGT